MWTMSSVWKPLGSIRLWFKAGHSRHQLLYSLKAKSSLAFSGFNLFFYLAYLGSSQTVEKNSHSSLWVSKPTGVNKNSTYHSESSGAVISSVIDEVYSLNVLTLYFINWVIDLHTTVWLSWNKVQISCGMEPIDLSNNEKEIDCSTVWF